MTDLDEIERLLAAATQGEWGIQEELGQDEAWCDWHSVGPLQLTGGKANADDRLIAALHNAAPDLIAAARRVKVLEKALKDLCDAWESDGGPFHGNITKTVAAARTALGGNNE